jgi:hypothetical protein
MDKPTTRSLKIPVFDREHKKFQPTGMQGCLASANEKNPVDISHSKNLK